MIQCLPGPSFHIHYHWPNCVQTPLSEAFNYQVNVGLSHTSKTDPHALEGFFRVRQLLGKVSTKRLLLVLDSAKSPLEDWLVIPICSPSSCMSHHMHSMNGCANIFTVEAMCFINNASYDKGLLPLLRTCCGSRCTKPRAILNVGATWCFAYFWLLTVLSRSHILAWVREGSCTLASVQAVLGLGELTYLSRAEPLLVKTPIQYINRKVWLYRQLAKQQCGAKHAWSSINATTVVWECEAKAASFSTYLDFRLHSTLFPYLNGIWMRSLRVSSFQNWKICLQIILHEQK